MQFSVWGVCVLFLFLLDFTFMSKTLGVKISQLKVNLVTKSESSVLLMPVWVFLVEFSKTNMRPFYWLGGRPAPSTHGYMLFNTLIFYYFMSILKSMVKFIERQNN